MFLSLSEKINANFSRQISSFINIVHLPVDEVNKRNTKRSTFSSSFKQMFRNMLFCKIRDIIVRIESIFFETPTRMYEIYNGIGVC